MKKTLILLLNFFSGRRYLLQSIGKQKEAIDLFKKIKTDYPLTEKAADVDKYLARLGQFSE